MQAARDRVPRRLAARDREEHEERVELEVVQSPEVVLDRRQQRQDVVAGRLALLRRDLLAIGEDLARRAFRAATRDGMLGVDAEQHVVRQGEEPVAVLLRNAEDVRDHVHRKLIGDLLHELDRLPLDRVFDDRDRPLPRQVLEPSGHARGEAGADQLPLTEMRLAIHVRQHETRALVAKARARDDRKRSALRLTSRMSS